MPTNNNYTYAPAAVDTGATAPAPIGPLDTAPAAVPPGPGLGYVPTTSRVPVVPQVEQPVQTQLTPEGDTGPNIPAVDQQRYISILENGTVVVSNASSLNFNGNVTVTALGTYGANITLSGGNINAGGSNRQIQYNNDGSFAGSSGLAWDNANAILSVTGNIAGTAAELTGFNSRGEHAANLGAAGFTELNSNVVLQITGNANSYAQINFQNISNGTHATTDYIATAEFGDDSTYFVDMGIASGNYDPTSVNNSLGNSLYPQDSYVYAMGGNSYGGSGGNLVIGSNEPGGVVRIIADGSTTNNIVATFSNVGVTVKGIVSATGNITGGNIAATEANITDVIAYNVNTVNINARDSSGVNISANGLNNLAVEESRVIIQNVPLSVVGNVVGGNILTGGLVSATANVTGGNISTAGLVTATGNITGGNVLTAGLISATSTITSAANITGGNLTTAGLFTATGNIIGGNVLTAGLISATSTITSAANITGANILANSNLSVVGNIIANNFTGYGNIIFNQTLSTQGGSDMSLIPGTGLVRSLGNLRPYFANTYDLGGSATRWNNIYANVNNSITETVTGNITGGNITTAGLTSTASLSVTGNTATITTANYSIGYLNVPQVSLAANSTIALTDSGKHYYSVSASNLSLTIANNTSVSWPVGTAISIINGGTANILINQDTGVSMYLAGNATAGNRVLGTFGMATIMNTAANTWFISGTSLT